MGGPAPPVNPHGVNVVTYRELPDHAHWVLGEPGWEDVARIVADWLA